MNTFLHVRGVWLFILLIASSDIGAQTFTDSGITLTNVRDGSLSWGDYDNDGDLDIFICGDSASTKISRILRNDGTGIFIPQYKLNLTGVIYSSMSWGDYDNDGDLDILLCGYDKNFKKISKIYRNDVGTFIDINAPLTGVGFTCSSSWGDYDNDGDLDVILSGSSSTNYVCKIFNNNGNGTFSEELIVSFPGITKGSIAWGDYNNDSYIDLILTGTDNNSNEITKLFTNDGDKTFTEDINSPLPGVTNSSVAWGDYDNDGDLDLLLTGWLGSGLGSISNIYNNNNGIFADINAGLTGVSGGSTAWGDYDNDGDLDILLEGSPGSGSVTKIYRNDSGSFYDISELLPTSVSSGCAAWGDYDNDGDLDILFAGYSSPNRFTKIYRNNVTITNTKPATPTGLSALNNEGVISLRWNKTTDNHTPQDGLSYNLYIYESGQINYKHPPHAFRQSHAYNGRRLVARIGNIQWSPSGYIVKNLPPMKTYYWSVQAVDAGLAGSSFSDENSFTVPLYRPSVQSSLLYFSGITADQAVVSWAIGGGTNRVVFIKADGEGNADPEDNTTYNINSLTPGGWKCVYNGISNSAIISGLIPDVNYSIHICEYNGPAGSELYLKAEGYQNPSVINTVFTEQTSISLPGSSGYSVVWGDFDNDNDMDLTFSGLMPVKIYGGTQFTEITDISLLMDAIIGSAAWGDFDNDGDLDILMTGSFYKGYSSALLCNNGDKTFTNQSIPMLGLISSSIAWGDYDNDGDLDVLMAGSTTLKYAKVYMNNGNKTFTGQSGISLRGVDRCSVSWADCDNDNDLDIFLTGRDDNSNIISRIYRNESNNIFVEQSQISLRGVEYGSACWGDYDDDGDLDLLLTGQEVTGSRISVIYRNEDGNSFSEQHDIVLPGIYYGSGKWGDYDNDGDMDILLSGRCTDGSIVSVIFKNNGNNSFTEQPGIILTGVYMGSVLWADYDNDSDLDILINGRNENGTDITKIYINNSLNTNNAPLAPADLSYSVLGNSRILLEWNRLRTDETSLKSLSYNVRIGRKSGGVNFVSPQSASNGYRKIPAMGNSQLDTSFIFNFRWDTLYYASVQAIDNSFIGGPFSNEIQIQISPLQPSELIGVNKSSGSILLKWKRGNGTRCILFAKEGTTGSASPQNMTTYYANPVFAEGSPIGTSGWYCIYKGEPDSVLLSGLNPLKNYRIHAIEFQGTNGSEIYAGSIAGSNVGTFSTALFTTTQDYIGLVNAGASSSAWGDCDNDGDLDILLFGASIGTYGPAPVNAGLFRNNGDNTFSRQTDLSLPAVYLGTCSWADYDNDNDMDMIITGTPDMDPVTKLFRNDGGNIFTEQTQIILPQVCYSSVEWGDYDNNGYLDILFTGATSFSTGRDPVSRIYKNYGNGVFGEQYWIPLTNVYSSAAAWGDYDNDGNPDILLTGATGPYNDYQPVSKVYHNNGDSTFTEVQSISLTGVYEGSVKWIDFDNDSDLDIFLCGATSSVYSDKQPVSKLYMNNGDGTFTERTDIKLTGVYNSSSSWGDYDSDGDPDLLLSGEILSNSCYSAIYRNDGDYGFTEMRDFSLINLGGSSAEWADYDNDGDLDFLLSGFDANDNAYTRIYRNNAVMMAASIPPNNKPVKPSMPQSEVTPHNVRLSWSPVSDDETPPLAMSYNLRFRPVNDTMWYSAPHSAANGFRRLVSMGNIQLNKKYDLRNWSPGPWEWQVQAVDQGYAGGAWSEIDTFVVKNTQAFFTADTVCRGSASHFSDQSVATEGIASWRWDFSDGTASTQQNPVHIFASGGTYSVKLVITSTIGDKDSVTQNVIVKSKPIASFLAPNVCEGLTAQITNQSNENGTTITGWYWNFGDGQISTVQNPVTHYYPDKGSYSIKLKATASNGCADSLTKPLVIASYPNAAVSITGTPNFCHGDSVILSAEHNPLFSYQWMLDYYDLSDGKSSSYTVKQNSGNYSLKVTNPLANCVSASASTAITVKPAPVPPYISASGDTVFCLGDSVELSVIYTLNHSYLWKKDGGVVGSDSTLYVAKSGGTYDLTVTNTGGCSVSSSNQVKVTANPSPSAGNISLSGPATFCQGGSLTLSVPSVTGNTYKWKNEYGYISGAETSSYTTGTGGSYRLEVSNASGCSAETPQVNITVKPSPVRPLVETENYTPGECQGKDPIRLSVNNTVPGYRYTWIKDGEMRPGDTLTQLEFYEKGIYKVRAELGDCPNESEPVTITLPDAPEKPVVYVRGPVVWYMAASSLTGDRFQWYRNGLPIQGATKYIYVANKTLGTYKVAVGNRNECYTMSDEVTIPLAKAAMTGFFVPPEYLAGEDKELSESIRVYPNPSAGLVNIEVENEVTGDLLVTIYNQDGKELHNFIFEKKTGFFSAELNLTGQPEGYYLLVFDLSGIHTVKKLIIE